MKNKLKFDRSKEEKFVKVLRHYSEAIGERPTGELHPDLSGSQDNFEDEANRAQKMEEAENHWNAIISGVKQVVENELENMDPEIKEGAFNILIDSYSDPSGNDEEFYVVGLADLIWKIINKRV